MGVLSKFFPRRIPDSPPPPPQGYVTFTENAPSFSVWDGTLYDHPLTRAAVDRFAQACSKLKPEVVGSENCKPGVRKLFKTWPNHLMTWPAFLARVATLYECDTAAWIVPGLDRNLNTVALFPLKPAYTEIAEYQGEPWCIFHLMTGETMSIEYSRCALIAKFQYESDIFGGGNDPLDSTLRLMDAQRQAEENAVKNGARIRFIGRVTGMTHGDDLKRKRERFYLDNLTSSNTTGLMIYDNTFDKIEQVHEQQFIIDEAEMTRVSSQAFYYLGTNEDILQNHYTEEHYGAWYEGKVEPFAINVSEALTKALYTATERMHGNYVMFSSNKLEYATNASKRNMLRDMLDRSVMTINEAREVLQLPPVEGGDVLIARGEYKAANGALSLLGGAISETDFDLEGDDDIYNDSDGKWEDDELDE